MAFGHLDGRLSSKFFLYFCQSKPNKFKGKEIGAEVKMRNIGKHNFIKEKFAQLSDKIQLAAVL